MTQEKKKTSILASSILIQFKGELQEEAMGIIYGCISP